MRKIIAASFIVLSTGCANNTLESMGLSQNFYSQPISDTTFYIKYTSSMFDGPFPTKGKLEPKWLSKAEELCGGKDFYYETKGQFLGKSGLTIAAGSPNLKGYVYCNNKIQDTREQKADAYYVAYQSLDISSLEFNDFTSLWENLTAKKFSELEASLAEIEKSFRANTIPEEEFNALLGTFARVRPELESLFDDWIATYPESYMAYHAKSVYLEAIAWHHRGNTYWSDVPEEQKVKFKHFSGMALTSTLKAIEINDDFFPSYAQLIGIRLSNRELGSFRDAYALAIEKGANKYKSVKFAYLRGLQPRWRGSEEEMRQYIDQEVARDSKNVYLESAFINDKADSLFQDKKYEQALDKYHEALAYYPSSYANSRIGNILRGEKKYVEAIKYYNTALSINPYDSGVYHALISTFISQGDYIAALQASNYLVAMDNQSAYNLMRQGHIYYDMRRYKDALLSYSASKVIESTAQIKHYIRAAEKQIEFRSNKTVESNLNQSI